MGRLPITALEELVKTNLLIGINNEDRRIKVAEWGDNYSVIGPADGKPLEFYFAGKKDYGDKNFYFIESDITINKNGSVSFAIEEKEYEVHTNEKTMPSHLSYVEFPLSEYNKRFGEVIRYTK